MKKFVCLLLVFVLMFALCSVAFAKNDVVSPEQGNTDIDIDNPEPSPQTGDTNTIFFVSAALILALGVVLFCGKKLIREK